MNEDWCQCGGCQALQAELEDLRGVSPEMRELDSFEQEMIEKYPPEAEETIRRYVQKERLKVWVNFEE